MNGRCSEVMMAVVMAMVAMMVVMDMVVVVVVVMTMMMIIMMMVVVVRWTIERARPPRTGLSKLGAQTHCLNEVTV